MPAKIKNLRITPTSRLVLIIETHKKFCPPEKARVVLNPRAIEFLSLINRLSYRKRCFASRQWLAEKLGVSLRYLRTLLKKFESLGFIDINDLGIKTTHLWIRLWIKFKKVFGKFITQIVEVGALIPQKLFPRINITKKKEKDSVPGGNGFLSFGDKKDPKKKRKAPIPILIGILQKNLPGIRMIPAGFCILKAIFHKFDNNLAAVEEFFVRQANAKCPPTNVFLLMWRANRFVNYNG